MDITAGPFKAAVRSGGPSYSDERLYGDYLNLRLSYNAEAEGLSRIGIVGYVSVYRPDLTDLFLIEPVKLLFICGIQSAERMMTHIKSMLNEEGKSLWADAGPDGRKWL